MFGNCFQKQFSIFETKKLVQQPKMEKKKKKTKIIFKTQFMKETKNMQKAVFSF